MTFIRFMFLILLPQIFWCQCSPAAVHSHSIHQERVEDGSYRARDDNHMKDGEHYSEFDHEAIIGSVKDAEEYDKLPVEESKRRLGILLLKMDTNGDKFISRDELRSWILRSFMKLSEEEAKEKFDDVDVDQNGFVTWKEYISETYGLESEYRIPEDENDSEESMISEDKIMFDAADENNDGVLDFQEFVVFFNPEEHPKMHSLIIEQTLKEKDSNNDGRISFKEFLGDKGYDHDKEWIAVEKDKFDHEYDLDQDGFLSGKEIQGWMIPNNNDIADDEVEHLFSSSDDDQDSKLSFEEVIEHHDIFVGSEATDYGDHLLGSHFDDEL